MFSYRLRNAPSELAYTQKKLANVTKVVTNRKNSKDGEVTLNVEDRFWRDELVNQLKKVNVFTDTSFNRERIMLDRELFYEACPDLFGDAGSEISNAAKDAASEKRDFVKKLMVSLSTGAATTLAGGAADKILSGTNILEIAKVIKDKFSEVTCLDVI